MPSKTLTLHPSPHPFTMGVSTLQPSPQPFTMGVSTLQPSPQPFTMGVSTDNASSILLCSEDNCSAWDFDDDVGEAADGPIPEPSIDLYEDPLMGFPLQSEDCVGELVRREAEHRPGGEYITRLMSGASDLSVRRDAIDWISKVHSYYSFGPQSACLSVNYLDRFLSAYELPKDKAWMTQLLSVACLSLASKMEESIVPLSLDLQVGDAKFVFEAKTIQRMELLVLSTLKWRMQAVTPFSYIDYFLHKFNDGDSPHESLIMNSVELVLSTIKGTGFLEFSPSEIAAAVVLYALGKEATSEIDNLGVHVNKERVLRCYEAIEEVTMLRSWPLKNTGPSVSSVPQSPNGVLDAASLSYKSGDATVWSQPNSHNGSPAAKRRKLNRPSTS